MTNPNHPTPCPARKYAKFYDDVMSRPDMSLTGKAIYHHLLNRQGKNGHAWPSVLILAAALAAAPRTIRAAIGELCAAGWITVENGRKGGRHRPNDYVILDPPPAPKPQRENARKSDARKVESRQILPPLSRQILPPLAPFDPGTYSNARIKTIRTIEKRTIEETDFSPALLLSGKAAPEVLLVSCEIHPKVARSLAEQHPGRSIEAAVKNGLAQKELTQAVGKEFYLPGYIVQSLNNAYAEGKLVTSTKLSRQATWTPGQIAQAREKNIKRNKQLTELLKKNPNYSPRPLLAVAM